MGKPQPLLSFIFGLFKQTSLQLLPQIYVKKCPSCIRCQIRTHDLRNMSLLQFPLDQDNRPI